MTHYHHLNLTNNPYFVSLMLEMPVRSRGMCSFCATRLGIGKLSQVAELYAVFLTQAFSSLA